MTKPEQQEIVSQNTIRIETAFSRFPVHRLAKRGSVSIEINERAQAGEIKIKWEVTHNSKYGQPGALAYKLDTVIINRRLEEVGRPLPKIITLGSLTEISKELGLFDSGKNRADIRKALMQNVGALINAKITYTTNDKTEKSFEAAFTRYNVIFTGEKLPDGKTADAVYLNLSDVYMKVLSEAQTRPLDYDYLRELSPGAQRFYELLSFQIFGAFANERPRAKMLYSYYCTRAPQTRYIDYEHVKKQMYKLHVPHKKSGYIAEVELRQTMDGEGRTDWEMLYTPGQRARAEFKEARRKSRTVERLKSTPLLLPLPAQPHAPLTEDDQLIKDLLDHGVHFDTATGLVSAELQEVRRQLEYLPYRAVKKNKAGMLRDAILGHWTPPDEYLEFKRKEHEQRENQERLKRKAAESEQAAARQQEEERRKAAYFDYLRSRVGKIEQEQPEAYRAFLDDTAAKRAALEADPAHKGAAKKIYLRLFDDEESHLERLREFFKESTFEEWKE